MALMDWFFGSQLGCCRVEKANPESGSPKVKVEPAPVVEPVAVLALNVAAPASANVQVVPRSSRPLDQSFDSLRMPPSRSGSRLPWVSLRDGDDSKCSTTCHSPVTRPTECAATAARFAGALEGEHVCKVLASESPAPMATGCSLGCQRAQPAWCLRQAEQNSQVLSSDGCKLNSSPQPPAAGFKRGRSSSVAAKSVAVMRAAADGLKNTIGGIKVVGIGKRQVYLASSPPTLVADASHTSHVCLPPGAETSLRARRQLAALKVNTDRLKA